MPTVIDTLIVELGLDPKKLTDGQRQALAAFKHTSEEAKKHGKEAEDQANRVVGYLGRLKTQALAFTAAAFGAASVTQFIENMTTLGAETGRTSKIFGQSAGDLSKWRNMGVQIGGTVAGMTGSIRSLVTGFQNFALTGQSTIVPYFRALGVNLTTVGGKMRNIDDIMLDLADKFSKMDPARAAAFGAALGFDAETINLLIRGREELEKMFRAQKELGNETKFTSDQSQKLLESWNKLSQAAGSLGRSITIALTPNLVTAFDWLSGILSRANKGASRVVDLMEQKANGNAPKSATGVGWAGRAEREAYYRAGAAKRGLNPDVVMQTVKSEGWNGYVGDKGTSFGDFQLHYKNNIPGLSNGGLGDTFTKSTGKDARDPSTWQAQADYALDQMKSGGLGPWHGWKGNPWAAHSGGGAALAAAAGADNSRSSSSTTSVSVGKIEVVTQATDAAGIARDLKPAIERSTFSQQAQTGPN